MVAGCLLIAVSIIGLIVGCGLLVMACQDWLYAQELIRLRDKK